MESGSNVGWLKKSGTAGLALWPVVVALLAWRGQQPVVESFFMLAPLSVAPLALAFLEPPDSGRAEAAAFRLAARLQPIAAAMLAGSFVVSCGGAALGLALPWVAFCVLVGLAGMARLAGRPKLTPDACCFLAAMLYLPIGGGWLAASRLGMNPMGFREPIVLLTAVHFHFTAFALPILVGLTTRRLRERHGPSLDPWSWFAASGVIAATPLIAAGFVLSLALKMAAILWLTASLLTYAVLCIAAAASFSPGPQRKLLVLSSACLALGMALACLYGAGEVAGNERIGIPRMAQIHGPLNGVGFALSALIAWQLDAIERKNA